MFLEHWRRQIYQIVGLNTSDSINVNRNLVVADALPDFSGYTWTLASALGSLLVLAEERFGPRDSDYCLLGIEFSAKGPKVWYPGNRKHIIIQLSLNSLTNWRSAFYELSHECIHLLSPTGTKNANVLEEGLAVSFSVEQMEKYYGIGWWSERRNHAYFEASAKVKELLALDNSVIYRLRQEEATISLITSEMILRHCPAVSPELAESLAIKFACINSEQPGSQQKS